MTAAATPLLTGSRSAITPLRFTRVLAREFRRSVSTRGSRWFIILIIGFAASTAFGASMLIPELDVPWQNWLQPVGFITDATSLTLVSPFLILLAAGEWDTRSVMTTFTLTPRRGWVLLAQTIVAVTYTVVFWLLCLGFGALVAAIAAPLHNIDLSWSVSTWDLLGQFLLFLAASMSAFFLGTAIMNLPAAIVATLALQMVMNMLLAIGGGITAVIRWIYLSNALKTAIADPNTGANWAHVATSAVVWLGIPAAIGIWRTLHREAA